jgi:hypothetical protein
MGSRFHAVSAPGNQESGQERAVMHLSRM